MFGFDCFHCIKFRGFPEENKLQSFLIKCKKVLICSNTKLKVNKEQDDLTHESFTFVKTKYTKKAPHSIFCFIFYCKNNFTSNIFTVTFGASFFIFLMSKFCNTFFCVMIDCDFIDYLDT